jgi:hypothetical protein
VSEKEQRKGSAIIQPQKEGILQDAADLTSFARKIHEQDSKLVMEEYQSKYDTTTFL